MFGPGMHKRGQRVDAVAKATCLHEHGGVPAGSVGAYGDSDSLLLPGGRNQVEEGVFVNDPGHPVYGGVWNVGDERGVPVLQCLNYQVGPLFRGRYFFIHGVILLQFCRVSIQPQPDGIMVQNDSNPDPNSAYRGETYQRYRGMSKQARLDGCGNSKTAVVF